MTGNGNEVDGTDWGRIQRLGWKVAGVGLIGCALGAFINPTQFLRSYLVAFIFWLSIPLGCLAIVMLQHLTGGAWGLVLRRLLESATRTLPLLLLLFIPVALGLPRLYPWSDPEIVAHDTELERKAHYLNVPFFLIRALVYFLAWLGMAYFVNSWSRQQDQSDNPSYSRRLRLLSGPGLALYGLTITFASIDWVMSLEPHWFSTIYGVMFGASQVLTALAFAIAVLTQLVLRPPLSEVVTAAQLRDLGNLTLAFVMLWAYLAFSQFLLIWAGNLPEETPWYFQRLHGGWQWLALMLIVLHFALPFVLLLQKSIKENPRTLCGVALGVLFMRFIDVFWQIEPAFPDRDLAFYWMLDVAAFIGIGGIWIAVFARETKRRPILPSRDDNIAEGVIHG